MSKVSWLAGLPLLIFVVLVAVFAVALGHAQNEAPKFAQHIGEPAPAIDLPMLLPKQGTFKSSAWRGKPVIVNFFASWCAPCRSEHEHLLRLAEGGMPIIGIAYQDKTDALKSYLHDNGNPFVTVAEDHDGRTGIDWGISGVPETFVIDADGMIRFHLAGPMTEVEVAQYLLPAWNKVKQ